MILAVLEARRRGYLDIVLGMAGIFIVAELILFQPNEYDNNKLLYVWFLLCLPMAADYALVPVLASSIILVPMIAEAACEGCLRIDKELIDVYRMNANFNGRVMLHVYLPLMAGYLRQAYVNAVGMGVKLAVSTE